MILKKLPERDDLRVVRRFAFFPTLLGDLDGGVYVWLQYYLVFQEYNNGCYENLKWHTYKKGFDE